MASPLILALDIGTSSSRTALFSAEGERFLHTTAQEKYPLLTSADGAAELEPEHLHHAILHCLRNTLQAYRQDAALHQRPIQALGTSCFWHSTIGLDRAGQPLTRIITWADGRCRQDAATLREEFREATVHQRTGCMLRASFWPARLAWLQRTDRRLCGKVQRWVSPAEWLQEQFCGGATCAIGMAAGTGLFDQTKLRWDDEMLQRAGLTAAKLNPVSDEPRPLSEHWLKEFPELRGAAWYPGIGDGAASNLGSGATGPGLAAINVGTSAALRVMRRGKKAQAPFGLFCYRVDRDRFLVGGAVSNAGSLRAWCLQELHLPADVNDLEEQLAARISPDHGLTVVPFWTPERAPTWNEEVPGIIVGLRQHTSGLDILQATTEAMCYRIARIAELVVKEEPGVPKFLVSGGIQNSVPAMQRLADALDYPLYVNPEAEASIRGAAVFAIEKLGLRPAALKLAKPMRPRKKLAALHRACRARQEALEETFARGAGAKTLVG